MTPIIYIAFVAIFSGALGYPTSPNVDRGLNEKKSPAAYYLSKQIESQKKNLEILSQHSSHPDLTQVITFSPGYSSEYNVRQDPPPSEDDLQKYRRRRDAGAEESEPYEDEEDDSDMFMEPMELTKTEVAASPTASTEQPEVSTETSSIKATKDNQEMGQHFFPSFAPVFSLGHSRPHQLFHQVYPQEPFYTSKARIATGIGADYNPFRPYRDNTYNIPLSFEDEAISTNILGSGNFGVLRGGTYYSEDDEYGGFYNSHFSNNGHGRPFYSNPRPQKFTNGDFFANFKDFAEINTPTKTSYSEYIVVYINKNSTKSDEEEQVVQPGSITKPKNIFEQLTLLDQSDSEEETNQSEEEKKISQHKRKLSILKQEKLNKQKKSNYKNKDSGKDFLEPLLALS